MTTPLDSLKGKMVLIKTLNDSFNCTAIVLNPHANALSGESGMTVKVLKYLGAQYSCTEQFYYHKEILSVTCIGNNVTADILYGEKETNR